MTNSEFQDLLIKEEEVAMHRLFRSHAPNLYHHVDMEAILMCDDIEEIEDSITADIQVSYVRSTPEQYLEENDPTLERAHSIAKGIWELDSLDTRDFALLVLQDDLHKEMNNLLTEIRKTI